MTSPRRSIALGAASILIMGLAGFSPAAAADPVDGAQTSGDSLFPNVGNGGYDVSHYDIDLAYSAETKAVDATTTIEATATTPLSSFSLDFEGLTIESLTVDGVDASYERVVDPDAVKYKLVVTPATPVSGDFTTVVTYSGVPTEHIDPDGSSEGWVATDDGATFVNEPVGAMTLFPNNNSLKDKATYDIDLTIPTTIGGLPAAAASNGELVSRTVDGDTTTWSWKQSEQMQTYLTLVSIGNFTVHEEDIALTGGRTITEYSFIDSSLQGQTLADTEASRAKLGPMLTYLERLFGRYPGNSTGIVVDPVDVGYALETQDRSFFDGSIDESTLLHELTHQWFGDAASFTDWSDLWLAEGPATFMERRYAFDTGLTATSPEKALEAQWDGTGAGDPTYTTPMAGFDDPVDLFAGQTYDRGAQSLQALRTTIGEADFDTLMSRWVKTRSGTHGSTADWIDLAEQVSGLDLTAFDQDWAYDADKPSWPVTPPSPVVTGARRVGGTLTAMPGTRATGVVLTYQWLADGTAISGATGATYVPRPRDLGRRIAVRVSSTGVGVARTSLTSSSTSPVMRGVQTRSPRPRISGAAKVGRVLRVRPGVWDPGTRLAYRWYVDGHRVRGGTDGSLRVPRSAQGDRIRVRVTSTKAGYGTASELSARTPRVR